MITRHGQPVVELKAVRPPARPITPEALDWLAERRAKRPLKEDAGTFVSRVRDEEWER